MNLCCSFGTNSTDCDEDKSKINSKSSIKLIGPNKKISVFRVTVLKILGIIFEKKIGIF